MKKTNLVVFLLAFLFIQTNNFAQGNKNLFAGIEIGSKGIKMTVLDINNIKKGDFTIKTYWSENVGIAKNISIDSTLAKEDIDRGAAVVLANYKKIKDELKVPDENIFIVGSSGVAMAKNTKDLTDKVKLLTQKDLDFIDAQTEGKMLLKGCIPPIDYENSMVLDIGGGNTKGGYVDILNNENFVFFPLNLNYGTITLTEAVNKKTRNNDISEYNNKSFGYLPVLREQVTAMYNSRPVALKKEKIYLSGGAVWAFYTLYNGVAKETFNEFKLEDVINYDAILKNNFKKFEEMAKTDKDVERVLKTYSQKYLISGSNILLVCLEAVPHINEKKLYFAKEGQIAWLVSYIADRSEKVKKVY
ncbi:Ppx/GppA phosphatase family protein [Flavobacterium luminosum]|uniref:Exopolyphosphatase n=1 Tax=Flavobacterium luminosum TaxID=2949086 RepID=A0ABT0TQE2_9FLAO|nr:exopolyphosphatase [Flavobacterium sp. HXWNR70]MCL9809279.1 exopolyphosphatase [Flavobacterium sp. HXWNR70]